MSRKLLKYILVGTVFLLIAGYAVFQSQNILQGAEISVSEPRDESVATTSILAIRGTALRAAHISLNDNPIFTDPAGNFSEKTALAPGTNIIKLQVEDRYKRQKTVLLHVYYDAPAPIIIPAFSTTTATTSTSAPSTN